MSIWTSATARAVRDVVSLLAICSVAAPLACAVSSARASGETLAGALVKAAHNIPGLLGERSPGKGNTPAALREIEQSVLHIAVQCYMDVLRDAAIYALDNDNIDVVEEQLQLTRDRLPAGQTSSPDIVQIEARLGEAHSLAESARATLKTSLANYRQVIGDKPDVLEPGTLPEHVMPETLAAALAIVQAAAASPGADRHASATQQAVETAWSAFALARNQIDTAQARVQSATEARDRTREALEAGKTTSLGALDVQQSLLKARVELIIAQHRRIVAGYTVLASIGRLSPDSLGLPAQAQATARLEASR